jgi:hypothetical protein
MFFAWKGRGGVNVKRPTGRNTGRDTVVRAYFLSDERKYAKSFE